MAVDLQLPPGFRFYPTDEELVTHYLCRKCATQSIDVPIIAEIDLYKHDPWELPGLALYGEKEWYFFSPRDRKYPNGSRPNRVAGGGYWKPTGADKPIGKPKPLGIKKALVFYAGKAPNSEKTNWIMHEYRLADVDRTTRKKNNKLDDWVLCRLYNRKGSVEKQPQFSSNRNMPGQMVEEDTDGKDKKPMIMMSNVAESSSVAPADHTNYMYLHSIDSVPKLHTYSSCLEHVASPEFSECEVQSGPKLSDWEKATLNVPFNYNDPGMVDNVNGRNAWPLNRGNFQMSPLHDMFMYLQKPF